MRRVLPCLTLVLLLIVPGRADAWGFEAHWLIMERAIALLPGELRPFFEAHRELVVQRAIDPDTWRNAGFAAEPPNHFIDLDWEGYGKDPFPELPHDYAAAVAKFGRERVDANGTVPWRAEEVAGNLRRAFEAYPRRPFSRYDILFNAAWLAHYVSDAHVPFHAVINYDGQLTGQHGIHTRFEATMFERYRDRLVVAPKPIAPVRDVREFLFGVALAGTRLVPSILKADLAAAIGTRDVYDPSYYDAFFAATRPVLEQRLNESIAAVAATIAGAWEAAGKPAVPATATAAPERRRRQP